MRKKFTSLLFVFAVLLLLFSGCGKVSDVKITTEPSQIYTEKEIDKAMDAIIREFRANYDKCTLLELSYNEAYNLEHADKEAQQRGADRVIIIHGSFQTGDTKNAFNPNFTYKNYNWILGSNGSGWHIIDRGYG